MAQRSQPHAPRLSAPDLPPRLEDADPLTRGGDFFQVRWTALDAQTDAAHAALTECAVLGASVERLDLTGATLVDVDVRDLRASALSARSARLRRVRITGGRIGTLDLSDTEIDEVELRGVRIDYVSLAAARIADLLIADCTIGALDLPQATVTRMAFADTGPTTSTPAGCGRRSWICAVWRPCPTSTRHRCGARPCHRARSNTSPRRWPLLSASASSTDLAGQPLSHSRLPPAPEGG